MPPPAATRRADGRVAGTWSASGAAAASPSSSRSPSSALVTLLLSAFGGSGRAGRHRRARERLAAAPGRPADARDRRAARHAAPPAAGQPVRASRRSATRAAPKARSRSIRSAPRRTRACCSGSSTRSSAASTGGPRWYQLPGGVGPGTSALDVGAAPGTDVYSPVDGTIVAIDDVVLERRAPRLAHRHPAERRTVARRLGLARPRRPVARRRLARRRPAPRSSARVVDFSRAEQQALARYTNDSGNHVVVEVHPSATLRRLESPCASSSSPTCSAHPAAGRSRRGCRHCAPSSARTSAS